MRLARRQRHLDESGFTLVELVVAMFVIAVVLLLLAGVQVSAMQSIVNATKREQATAYANQAMEIMRSLPWNTLSKGNVPGFHTAGGNDDPYYTGNNMGGTVSIDGETYTVRLALTTPQDLSDPRPPLFDSTGSNHIVQTDPTKPGVEFSVRSYVVDSVNGSAASVGLLVIVSWTNSKTGETDDLALRSSAYDGSAGCGDRDEMPYLVACQDRFTFSSTSGYVGTSLTASQEGSSDFTPLIPGSNVQEVSIRSALLNGSGDSVQVTSVTGEVRRGGTTVKLAPSVPGGSMTTLTEGNTSVESRGSNNFASDTGVAADHQVTASVGASTSQYVGSGALSLGVRSDDSRTGSTRSNTTQACLGTQLFAGEPCTYTELSGAGTMAASLGINSATMHPLWRSSNAISTAGGGRFLASKPGTQYGCQTLDASGCASARASYQETSLRVGHFTNGGWDQGISTLIEIANYSDAVRTERGSVQMSTAPSLDRDATIRFWNGSNVVTTNINESSSGTIASTGEVTWSPGGGVSVAATGSVSATPVASQVLGENPVVNCKDDSCVVYANAGSITVSVRYVITSPWGNWELNQQTVLAGSAATTSFDRRT